MTELESSDSSVASTIKEVFESDRPEDHKAFLETLANRLNHHNAKIEKMCASNYTLFVDCVSQLVRLCPKVSKLQTELRDISETTAAAIQGIPLIILKLKCMKELIDAQKHSKVDVMFQLCGKINWTSTSLLLHVEMLQQREIQLLNACLCLECIPTSLRC